MTRIELTEQERRDGRMRPDHLDDATHALRQDGIVQLVGAVDTAHLDILRERMLDDLAYFIRRYGAPDKNY